MNAMRPAVAASARRIAPWVWHTPTLSLAAGEAAMPIPLRLKLEPVRHAGGFYPRGAVSRIPSAPEVPPVVAP